MALVKATMFAEFMGQFGAAASDPFTPGEKIASGFEKYLKGGQNMGGFPTTGIATTSAAGKAIGAVFSMQLPVGASIGTLIGSHLLSMALTYQSTNQIGPPVVSTSHMPKLIKLYSGPQPSGMSFAKELSDILDTWTKTWVVSGLIPGAPPVPFSGPLS